MPCFNTQPPEGGWWPSARAVALGKNVSTHSRPKAAGKQHSLLLIHSSVSTHSRPKAAGKIDPFRPEQGTFQHTAARRRLVHSYIGRGVVLDVSTHSRPKAAGSQLHRARCGFGCFNTQPPEGGWRGFWSVVRPLVCFNTQPPEGGWRYDGLVRGRD